MLVERSARRTERKRKRSSTSSVSPSSPPRRHDDAMDDRQDESRRGDDSVRAGPSRPRLPTRPQPRRGRAAEKRFLRERLTMPGSATPRQADHPNRVAPSASREDTRRAGRVLIECVPPFDVRRIAEASSRDAVVVAVAHRGSTTRLRGPLDDRRAKASGRVQSPSS